MKRQREVRFELPKGAPLRQSHCTACGASIFWMVTKNDKKMPLSAASARVEYDDVGDRHVTYVSHFSDCPKASSFRASKSL